MAELNGHRARSAFGRRLIVATTTVLAFSVVFTYPANANNAGKTNALAASTSNGLHVSVEPTSLSLLSPNGAPNSPSKPAPRNPAAQASGAQSASIAMPVHVRVLPGKAQWLVDTSPGEAARGNTRILAGTVLYAVGDNRPWKLVAHVSGIDGAVVIPSCVSTDTTLEGDLQRAISGDTVTANGQQIVVCEGVRGQSGGVFAVSLDVQGRATGDIAITVELIL
ncbi:MAG: hypothetical protein WCK14_01120 [Actinomycetota bacterium]